jgi:integrase
MWFSKGSMFDEVSSDFLKEKKVTLRPHTYSGYVSRIRVFKEWLEDNSLAGVSMQKITETNIRDFSIYISDVKDLDKETVKKYKATLIPIFKAAGIKELPFNKFLIPIKKRDCSPKYVPQDKQVPLLKDLKENNYQLFLACMIQYTSGIRPNELRNLQVKDILLDSNTICIKQLIAKTKKIGYADLTDELKSYLIEYGILNADPELYLFGLKGKMAKKPLSVNMLGYYFRAYRKKHNINPEVKFYSWKHTGGTDLITSKIANMPQLQKHFRHTNMSSTIKYIENHSGITNDVIKEAFKSPAFHT